MRWLHLRLHAPLGAFGDAMIDSRGPIADFPARSMLTGLLANALGWRREERAAHQALQDRLILGALWEHEPAPNRITDYQTARLGKDDKGWTTRGAPVGRDGGPATYDGAHQRWREYHADLRMRLALRLSPEEAPPTLDDLAAALARPARPLFIGRKPCLPAAPLLAGFVEAPDIRAALALIAPAPGVFRAAWPAEETSEGADSLKAVNGKRNWLSGLHGGSQRQAEGRIIAKRAA